jgi:hypothetical protein
MGRDKHFVVMFVGAAHVRFGSEADIASAPRHVRFTPESGHQLSALGCPLCANRRHRPPHGLAFRSPVNRPYVLGYLQLLYPCGFDTSVYNECLAILARHLEAIEDTRVPDCLPVLRLAPAIKIISRTIGKIFDRLYAVLTKGDEHWRRYAWNILQTVINAKLLSLSIKIHLHAARSK